MTMFESVYEMNDDIQRDCNDSFSTMFIEEYACALWKNQQRFTWPTRLVVHTRQLSRGVFWITENSPTTQGGVLWITDCSSSKELIVAASSFPAAFVLVSDNLAVDTYSIIFTPLCSDLI